jgi:hypothetical protein
MKSSGLVGVWDEVRLRRYYPTLVWLREPALASWRFAFRSLSFASVIINIDLTEQTAGIGLLEPEDGKRFHVAVRGGDPESLRTALSANDLGRLLPSGDVMIETSAVERLAHGQVPDGWRDEFASMLEYAKGKGWLDEHGAAIQAHVEWIAGAG